MYYALKEKGRFAFLCAARTPKEHEEKVQQAYWRWRGVQPRETAASIDEFMAGYEQVKVTLEPYNAKSEPTARILAQVGSTDGLEG